MPLHSRSQRGLDEIQVARQKASPGPTGRATEEAVASPAAGEVRRAIVSPRQASPAALLQLQRTAGNRAVGRLLDRRAASSQMDGAGADGHSTLPASLRNGMESALDADLSNVRIHTGSPSATLVGALAYTRGNEVHFAPGQYQPHTQAGRELLGHELAHVVQQRQGRVNPTTSIQGLPASDDPALEAEAAASGRNAARTAPRGVESTPGVEQAGVAPQAGKGPPPRAIQCAYEVEVRRAGEETERVDIDDLGLIDDLFALFERLPKREQRNHRAAFLARVEYLRSHGAKSRYRYSYQNPPALLELEKSEQQRGVTRYSAERGGGPVTPNPSPFFPGAAAGDLTTYGGPGGTYSRFIGYEDLEDLVDRAITSASSSLFSVKRSVSSGAARAKNVLRGGPSYSEERATRERLVSTLDVDDPRVTHYMRAHKERELAQTGASSAASLGTGGIAGVAQSGLESGGQVGLAIALKKVMEKIENQRKNAHSASELPDPDILPAVKTLRRHYLKQGGKSLGKGLAKVVPFLSEGLSIASSAASAASSLSGLPEKVKQAGTVIYRLGGKGDPYALEVVDLLGIPRELLQAQGGEKVIHQRLG